MLLELTIINVASVIIKVAIKVDFNSPKTNFLVPSYLRRPCIGYDRLLVLWDVTREHRETGNAIQWRSQPETEKLSCCLNYDRTAAALIWDVRLLNFWWLCGEAEASVGLPTVDWHHEDTIICGNANKLNTKYQNFSFLVWFKVFDLK